MRASVSRIASMLAAALLLNAMAIVDGRADAQTSAPACPGGKATCKKKPNAQPAAVVVNTPPGDREPGVKTGAVKVNAPPGDAHGTTKRGAVEVNAAPPAGQPGVHRTTSSSKRGAAVSRGRPTCVGECASVQVNSPDKPKK